MNATELTITISIVMITVIAAIKAEIYTTQPNYAATGTPQFDLNEPNNKASIKLLEGKRTSTNNVIAERWTYICTEEGPYKNRLVTVPYYGYNALISYNITPYMQCDIHKAWITAELSTRYTGTLLWNTAKGWEYARQLNPTEPSMT